MAWFCIFIGGSRERNVESVCAPASVPAIGACMKSLLNSALTALHFQSLLCAHVLNVQV